MKRVNLALAAIISVLFLSSMAYGGKISADYGKELFNDAKLGGSTNESSCNNCHADGKALENVGSNPKLTKLINSCITEHLEGQKMDGRKAEMRSLKKYVQSLGK